MYTLLLPLKTIGVNLIHSSFADFDDHLRTNAVGPIIIAQKLLRTALQISLILFMSSDSGSASEFRAFEDG